MDFLKLVTDARTCRRFDESHPLDRKDLLWLVECARLAPSARNAQELRFITVSPGSVLDKLFGMTRWAGALKDWNGPEAGERPTGFVAVLRPEKSGELTLIDTGIACQTMQLAASSRGWGACMIYSFERQGARELLNVPDELKIELVVAFGVAKEKRVVADVPASGGTTYWRDAQNVHYVPKRGLNELVIKEL